MPIKSVLARIEGRVQGVWYRGWTAELASKLGLDGWVMNMPDGSVEALFSGAEATVDEMLVYCYSGPKFAQVQSITTKKFPRPVGKGFNIKD